ncbi:glycosyltransferase family 2 protein [Pontibacter sp. H259]|uniref:glycosyltransferase family 2 protein n=1 Tax=Pontibacter sp. H259 TaxID=3133421 RepID=UPI0030C5AB76
MQVNYSSTVHIIIINYYTSHLIIKLLDSLDEKNLDIRITILDNASTDKTFCELSNIVYPNLTLLRSFQNLGFTGGINFALKNTDYKADYVFLLNPDALTTPGLISDLINTLKEDNSLACVSPKIYNINGDVWYSGAIINYKKGIVINNTIKNEDKNIHLVDVYSGCAVLFRYDALIKTGPFNKDLFMYYDEADYSLKLIKTGYKIGYIPSSIVFHNVSYTTKNHSHLKTYYMSRNKFYVFGETMSMFWKIRFITYYFLYYVVKGKYKNSFYHLKGIFHYYFGKNGQLIA